MIIVLGAYYGLQDSWLSMIDESCDYPIEHFDPDKLTYGWDTNAYVFVSRRVV